MLLPVVTKRVVDALGGPGAWRRKPTVADNKQQPDPNSKRSAKAQNAAQSAAAANSTMWTKLLERLHVPMKVWLGPIGCVTYFRGESDLEWVGWCIAVYGVMVAGQVVQRRFEASYLKRKE